MTGTASQLYLALSLAGVLEVEQERRQAGQETVPIMLDDVLMAFDDEPPRPRWICLRRSVRSSRSCSSPTTRP
jgi:uncharacterized protein YhaN